MRRDASAAFCLQGRPARRAPVYDNPLRTSAGDTVRLADPFVYESEGLYYMTGTTASAEASGFDYYVSSDLVAWEYGGPLFRKSPAHFGAGAFWAPEVERYEGRFYMTYSLSLIHISEPTRP